MNDPASGVERRQFRPVRPETSGIFGGLILLVLVAILGWIVHWCVSRQGASGLEAYHAFVPAGKADQGMNVRLQGIDVGRVDSVGMPRLVLQFTLLDLRTPGTADVLTLAQGDSLMVSARRGVLELIGQADSGNAADSTALEAVRRERLGPRAVQIRWSTVSDSADLLAVRRADGQWSMDGPATGVTLNGKPLAEGRPCPGGGGVCVRTGDMLDFGGIRLGWNDLRLRVPVRVVLDRRKLGRAQGGWEDAPPRRFVLKETGAFGIGRSGLELRILADWSLMLSDSARVLVMEEGIDLTGLRTMLAYLTDPALAEAPPASRFEYMVSDIGGATRDAQRLTASTLALVDRIERVTREHEGEGAVARLVLEPDAQKSLAEALDSIPPLLGDLKEFTRAAHLAVDTTARSLTALAGTIDTAVAGITPGINSAVANLDALSDSLRLLTADLKGAIHKGESGAKTLGIVLILKLIASGLLDIARLAGIR